MKFDIGELKNCPPPDVRIFYLNRTVLTFALHEDNPVISEEHIWAVPATCFMLVYSSTLKMEAACSSETSVNALGGGTSQKMDLSRQR
jgi:hypothetical protein